LAWLFLEQLDADLSAVLADDMQEGLLRVSGSDDESQMFAGLQTMRSSLLENGLDSVEKSCLDPA
jgi:hypothetical protein